MALRPVLKPWYEEIREAPHLFVQGQNPKISKAILNVAELIQPKNATSTKGLKAFLYIKMLVLNTKIK